MPGILEDGSAAAPDVGRAGGCITYREKEHRELKGRGDRDTFWYEWNSRQKWRERETD